MKKNISPELKARMSRLVLESLVKLTENENRSWVFFPAGAIYVGINSEDRDSKDTGCLSEGDISKLLRPYVKEGLVFRPNHHRPSHNPDSYPIRNGGYRANHERYDRLREIIQGDEGSQ